MFFSLSLLALSGLASAIIPHPQGKLTLSDVPPPSFNYKRDLLDRDTAPCKVLSEAYKAANGTGSLVVVDVPPSVGIACLKSVPVDKKRDLELIDWLLPYVEFHTTIDVLVHPPAEYLSAAVDILGGIQKVKEKLQKDGYEYQYDVMTDIRSIFVASHDNHFHYFAPIFNIFDFVRPNLQFISISHDGIRTPEIFMTTDWARGNKGKLDYFPSAISSVDGIPVIQWIQNNAEQSIASCHDPDALFNTQLTSFPRLLNNAGDMTNTQFEIPDQHVVKFRNGSKLELPNMVRIYATSDFSNINSGEDLHKEFELPVATTTTTGSKLKARATATSTASAEAETPTIVGYPYPVFKGPLDSFSGYFLNETGYEDVAVLSILSFEPLGTTPDNYNSTDPQYRTRAVLLSDDDVFYRASDLEYVFQMWRQFGRERMTGALARCALVDQNGRWEYQFCSQNDDAYSMVLTNLAFTDIMFLNYYFSEDPAMTKIRNYVDDHFNCEDIALNFVASLLTHTGPLLVRGSNQYVNLDPSTGISRQFGHLKARSECLNAFAEIFTCMPLVNQMGHLERGVRHNVWYKTLWDRYGW